MSPAPRAGAIVGVLACAGIVASLMQTLVVPLIGELPRLLDTSPADASWVLTATLLAGAVATPVVGRMGDLYGKRRVLLGCVALLVAGSVVSGLADSLVPMVVGRALQGMASGIIPLGISIMRDVLPAERLGSSIALMSSSLGVGGAFGLPLSAVVVDNADWHALFWGTAVLAVLIGVLVFLFVPESEVRARGRFDHLGAAGLSAGLVCLLLAVSKGGDWGWDSGTTLGLFGAAALILLLWGFWELRVAEPLVDLRTTARRQVLLTNLASIVIGFSMYAMSVLSPQILQLPEATGYGLGQSMLAAGLWMAPAGLVMMVVSPIGAKLSAVAGPKISLLTGALIIAAGYGVALPLMGEAWGILAFSCVCSAGVAFAYGAMPALIMGAVPASETAAANGFNTLMRAVGTSTSSAVIGVVLAQMTVRMGPVSIPSENGFRVGFLIGAGVAVAAALLTLSIPGRRRRAPAAQITAPAELAGPAAPAPAPVAPAPARAAVPEVPAATGSTVVSGTVLSGSRPVTGAAVTLIDDAGRQAAHAVSGEGGRYALSTARTGPFLLVGSAAGFEPAAVPVQAAGAAIDADVRLTGPAGAGGTVRDAVTGEAVPGATVVAVDGTGDVLSSTVTGDDGAFFLTDLAAPNHTLAVRAAGYRPQAFQSESPGAAGYWAIALEPAATLSGTVRATSGNPLPDIRVAVLDSGGNVVAASVTGADGFYRFDDLAAADYTLVASGYAPVAGTVNLNGTGVDAFDLELSQHVDPQSAAPVRQEDAASR
ncbi:MFS transporter [Actinomadura rugatobispora]|uniref:MFS transporter n=1 Tax=Actinomadura rugatobispora TaxID=1994 RepID=A0ABW0ZYG0_9ACTN|nr:MFS transporter [Actinomadura rugatobispora]